MKGSRRDSVFEFEVFIEFLIFIHSLTRGVKNTESIKSIKKFILTQIYSKNQALFIKDTMWIILKKLI